MFTKHGKQAKIKIGLFSLIVLSAITLIASLVLGGLYDSIEAQETNTSLDTIVVTSGRDKQTYREVPQPITVITHEEIQEKHPADVGDLLRQKGFQY
ncbi:MAG: hypothetical protein LBF22_04135, partial [Deltaproteobacteria bacterium]|nr:hypothetical protein [Deltaproteobacteria bacterium]